MSHSGILIMISYEIDIGFAIGRLISAFYEMGVRVTGDTRRVHFSFGHIGGGRCASLPASFENLLEFDYRNPTDASLTRFGDYIERNRIGVIFGLDLPVQAKCLAVARRRGVRTIFSYWGAPMSSPNHGLKLALKKLEVSLLRRAKPNWFIFESEAMRMLGVSGRGLTRPNTAVVHTGVDEQRFRPRPEASHLVYRRFGIPENRKVVVYMGHLHRRKGVHVLLQAAEHISTHMRRDDVHTLFLGDRPGEADAFSEHYSAAAPYITFGGYQTDIPELLSGCYVGCIPSTGWDSFPMSSLEMQSCGLPVIVSDLQGVPETVLRDETGLVVAAGNPVELAHAIVSLVDAPERREQMRVAARTRIENGFTRKHQIDALVECVASRLGDVGERQSADGAR